MRFCISMLLTILKNHFGKYVRRPVPVILWDTYPNELLQPQLSSFRLSLAHYLEVGMLNCFLAFDPALTTCIGVIKLISISGFYIANPSEIKRLKDFEELYNVIYGIELIPANEDKFIIADFQGLCFIFLTIRAFKHAIVTQFTFIKSTIYLNSAFSYLFIKAIPTLLTSIPTSNFSICYHNF